MYKLHQRFLLIALSLAFISSSALAKSDQKSTRFAVIGDYGMDGPNEKAVADLVKQWRPEFIVTVGDNNYQEGEAETIDENIGKYYHQYIYPYKGEYGSGADKARFFPILGNHDWRTEGAEPYLQYFDLPGNKRYYDFKWGPVHFFALDSDKHEPDGIDVNSKQAMWLKEQLKNSKSPYKVVLLHHPPYSSGHHRSTAEVQWPYKQWGANLVLSGHDHDYQHMVVDGLTYIVNGVGGQKLRKPFEHPPIPGTRKRIHDHFGALFCKATATELACDFVNVQGKKMDGFTIKP